MWDERFGDMTNKIDLGVCENAVYPLFFGRLKKRNADQPSSLRIP
jgi:hypothetical protein